MSKRFDFISIFLIVVLIIILFFVVYSYFNGSSILLTNANSNNNDLPTRTLNSGNNEKIVSNVVPSGDISNVSEHKIESGEESTETTDETARNEELKVPNDIKQADPSYPLIISSDSNISSNEKKEVLKELDQTLMELLDVVDSVKTVDESRLIIDEGEVQP